MGKKHISNSSKTQRAVYPSRAVKNRQAKLERHLKKFPNDEQAKAALKEVKGHTRKSPNTKSSLADRTKQQISSFMRKTHKEGNYEHPAKPNMKLMYKAFWVVINDK